jgi:hypothetical protein
MKYGQRVAFASVNLALLLSMLEHADSHRANGYRNARNESGNGNNERPGNTSVALHSGILGGSCGRGVT